MLEQPIKRRKTKQIFVRNLPVGGNAPISVQSMTNTNTADHLATIKQIKDIMQAGADLVRVSVPNQEAIEGFEKIRAAINTPLIADIHFDYKLALQAIRCGADCIRINPGNIGKKQNIKQVVDACKNHNIPIRIGVNAGSLEKDIQTKYGEPNARALVESAMRHVDILDQFNFTEFKIAVKASDVLMTVEAYRILSKQIEQPLHLGITEAGSFRSGAVKSAIGIGTLLSEGIGDTLRVSLAADPVQEIKVGFDILKSLRLRKRGINLIACPSCSRQEFNVIEVVNQLEARLEDISESIDVAIIGCVVNGPGEASVAKIGLTGGQKRHLLYIDGEISERLHDEGLVDYLEKKIRDQIQDEKPA